MEGIISFHVVGTGDKTPTHVMSYFSILLFFANRGFDFPQVVQQVPMHHVLHHQQEGYLSHYTAQHLHHMRAVAVCDLLHQLYLL